MGYLIDTVVLSELRKRDRSKKVEHWFSQVSATDVFLSVVTIGEIEKGISGHKRKNELFAQQLARWLDGILVQYGDRVIPVSVEIARRWGKLSAEFGHSGSDLLIAATAVENGLTVVTRNMRHFEPTGVPVFDPFV